MLTRLIGDIHGEWDEYTFVAGAVDRSIQVGDFGIGFAGPYWHDRANLFHADRRHRFIRGNHDNPTKCRQEMDGWIADGTIENDVMFIGGAWSIDHAWRTPNVDWWVDEELSYSDLQTMIDVYDAVRPRVMITHDAPDAATTEMFIKTGETISGGQRFETRTGMALQAMFEKHRPEAWYFGHWHKTKSLVMEGTTFQCLGIHDYIDVEL